MSKKSQSISINTIIIAAIALAVLVVLFVIFTGRLGIFSKGLQETDTCKQKCDSLNMGEAGSHLLTESGSCTKPAVTIAGSYKDGPFGCCCVPK